MSTDVRAAHRDVASFKKLPDAPYNDRFHHFLHAWLLYIAVIPAGCRKTSSSRHYLQTLAAQREAKTEQASAEREEMHRKSGHHTPKRNAAVRGSEGWRTPCPGKHGITSQITLSGSQRKAPSGKAAALSERPASSFIFTQEATPITKGN